MLASKWLLPRASVALAALACCTACNKTPEPDPTPAPPPPIATLEKPRDHRAAPVPAPTGPAEVTWDAPAAWVKAENPSPMRKATYRIPHAAADADDAELSVSSAGGTVELNVNRWAGQLGAKLEDVKREKKRVGGLEVTIVEIHGTYSGMAMPGAAAAPAKTGWALLGAIVGTSTPTFFKMTGPDKTVAAARADFDKLVDSLRAK
jgi:hypothetical protein